MPVLAYMRELFKVMDNILAFTPTHLHVAKQEPMTYTPKLLKDFQKMIYYSLKAFKTLFNASNAWSQSLLGRDKVTK